MKQKDRNIIVSITDVDRSSVLDSESFVLEEDSDILNYATTYNKIYNNAYKWLINKRHMSSYDSETNNIEKQTMIRPICCTFKYDQSDMCALDLNKAYGYTKVFWALCHISWLALCYPSWLADWLARSTLYRFFLT